MLRVNNLIGFGAGKTNPFVRAFRSGNWGPNITNLIVEEYSTNVIGSRIYSTDGNDIAYQINLSTPYDLTSVGTTFEETLATSYPGRVSNFSSDGTKYFRATKDTNNIHRIIRWSLGSTYNLQTAESPTSEYTTGYAANTSSVGLWFNSLGTEGYLGFLGDNKIVKFSMSTPWDNSTITSYEALTNVFQSGLSDVVMSDDGKCAITVEYGDDIYGVYEMNTPYDFANAKQIYSITDTELGGIEISTTAKLFKFIGSDDLYVGDKATDIYNLIG